MFVNRASRRAATLTFLGLIFQAAAEKNAALAVPLPLFDLYFFSR